MLSREEIEKEINLGNFEYVIEKCNEYLNLNSDLAFLYNYRGLCKNNLGLYEEAIKDFDISIELNKKVENKDSFIWVVSKSTCSHCASYKPKIETIVKEYGIDVYYIDFDDEDENTQKEFLDKFDLDGSTPITLFFKKGSEVSVLNRIEGDLPEEKVISTFKKMGFIED